MRSIRALISHRSKILRSSLSNEKSLASRKLTWLIKIARNLLKYRLLWDLHGKDSARIQKLGCKSLNRPATNKIKAYHCLKCSLAMNNRSWHLPSTTQSIRMKIFPFIRRRSRWTMSNLSTITCWKEICTKRKSGRGRCSLFISSLKTSLSGKSW